MENNNETVTITKGQLDGLLSRIESLEKGSKFEKPKRITERNATLRFFRDKPVVWYGNVNEKRDPVSEKMIASMDIKLLGEDHVSTVNYIDFLNATGDYQNTSIPVAIKKQTAKEILKSQGVRTAENPDPVNNKKFQEREIEFEVTSYEYDVDVEVLEGKDQGKVFTVPSLCLNQ